MLQGLKSFSFLNQKASWNAVIEGPNFEVLIFDPSTYMIEFLLLYKSAIPSR